MYIILIVRILHWRITFKSIYSLMILSLLNRLFQL